MLQTREFNSGSDPGSAIQSPIWQSSLLGGCIYQWSSDCESTGTSHVEASWLVRHPCPICPDVHQTDQTLCHSAADVRSNSGPTCEPLAQSWIRRLVIAQPEKCINAAETPAQSLYDWSRIAPETIRLLPSKHGAFTQSCFNVGTASSTLPQHWNSIGWMPRVCWVMLSGYYYLEQWNSIAMSRFPVTLVKDFIGDGHWRSYNIGIQMRRKELTKTFMMIPNWKKSLVSMVYTKIYQRCQG